MRMIEYIIFTLFGVIASSAYYYDNPVIKTVTEERIVTEYKTVEIEVPKVVEKIVYKKPNVSCKLIIEE